MDRTDDHVHGHVDGLPLDDDYAAPRELETHKVISADGTMIAYDKCGTGPALVVIGGGLNDKAMFTPLVGLMADQFTLYNYDRRGRGESDYGDPDGWTMQREIEDLVAVLDAVGEPAHVFANCTGGMVAILAAAQGVPMLRMGLYEPPYDSPPATAEQLAELKVLIAEGRNEEVVTIFGRDIVKFMSEETLNRFKQHPAWQAFLTMAPSCYYDGIISKDYTGIPHAELPKVSVPTLVMSGCESSAEIQNACEIVAGEIPGAKLLKLEGQGHLFDQKAGAPLLTEFFQS